MKNFRVYDKESCEFVNVLVVDFQKQAFYIEDEGGFFSWLDFKNTEILNYTGIDDKNGQEIYTGYKIQFLKSIGGYGMSFSNPKESISAEVVFKDGCYLAKDENDVFYKLNELEDIEIIGNIFEDIPTEGGYFE